MNPIGRRVWAIADNYIPAWSHGREPEMTSHEAVCVLNAGERDAHVELTLFFEEREPVGPYRFTVPARRSKHVRLNNLETPAPVPRGIGFSSILSADQPVVVQQTRLDSRQSENALLSTIAHAVE